MKEAHKVQDLTGIDEATAELNAVFQAASQEMYNAASSQGQEGAAGGGHQGNPGAQQQGPKGDGEVTDVDFEEVK